MDIRQFIILLWHSPEISALRQTLDVKQFVLLPWQFLPKASLLSLVLIGSLITLSVLRLLLGQVKEPPPRIWASQNVLSLVACCPTLLRGPQPPWWARGSFWQLVLWMSLFLARRRLFSPIAFKRYEVSLSTHFPKKRRDEEVDLSAIHDHIELGDEVCSIDICPGPEALPARTPCVIILSGLRGHSHDLPGTTQAQAVIEHGWRCIVFHRRGHTPGQKLTRPRFNIFGDVDDTLRMLDYVRDLPGIICPETPLFLIGNSTGSALCFNVIRHLGKDSPFTCALGICPGYEVSLKEHSCSKRCIRAYERVLLTAAKKFFCQRNQSVLESFDPVAYKACMEAETFHDFFVAHTPFAGYSSATDYVEAQNPIRGFAELLKSGVANTPTVMMNSEDDPVAVVQNVLDHAPLIQDDSAPIGVVLSRTGSHCPFFDGPTLGCWTDVAMLELFDACLASRDCRSQYFCDT